MFRVPFLAHVAANRSVGCTTEFVNIGRNVVVASGMWLGWTWLLTTALTHTSLVQSCTRIHLYTCIHAHTAVPTYPHTQYL